MKTEEREVASGVDGPRKVCLVTLKKVYRKGELPPSPRKGRFCHTFLLTVRDFFTSVRMCVARRRKYPSQHRVHKVRCTSLDREPKEKAVQKDAVFSKIFQAKAE